MIDREARNKLAEEIRHFLTGLSDNIDFDKAAFEIKTEDKTVLEIREQMWHTYEDFFRYKLKGKYVLPDKHIQLIKRLNMFLKTDFECAKFNKHTDFNMWPFKNKEEFDFANNNPIYLRTAT